MKHLYLLVCGSLTLIVGAQTKTTNPISVQNFSANFTLDQGTQQVTLTMTGPSDRWLAVQFGQFSSGMASGSDVVYYNGNTLVDGKLNGTSSAPSADSQNNWTVTQNTVVSGVRTLVATRAFNSPDATDYDFDFTANTLGVALARGASASFTLANHGTTNRIMNTQLGFTTLGVTNPEQTAVVLFPNPARERFAIQTIDPLVKVNIYQLNGVLTKQIPIQAAQHHVEVDQLAQGTYLVEIETTNGVSWKRMQVE